MDDTLHNHTKTSSSSSNDSNDSDRQEEKKKKQKQKRQKIALAVQHSCQPRADPPPARCLINPTYIARRDLSFLFSIDIVNDVVLS